MRERRSLSDDTILSEGLRAEHRDTGDVIGTDSLMSGPGNLVGLTAQFRVGKLDQAERSKSEYRLMLGSDVMTTGGSARFALVHFDGQFRRPLAYGISVVDRSGSPPGVRGIRGCPPI